MRRIRVYADGSCDYAKLHWSWKERHERLARRVASQPHPLTCQECGGAGGETDVILDDGSGPWEQCGWCEGIGKILPHRRSEWLRYKRSVRKPESV